MVVLKHAKMKEAIGKILTKCATKKTLSGVLTTCVYKDKEISVSIVGKLVIKESDSRERVEEILNELLE